jgi:glucose-6-phosphate isomerase
MTKRLLNYDWNGVQLPSTGLAPEALQELSPQLISARDEVIADVDLWNSNGAVPAEKAPLDAGFIEMPERLLAEYNSQRETSELQQILTASRRLSESVDRVVLLGIGGSYMGARALMECCNHPYHNELNRAQRGGVPRLYFEGNNVDNDATNGLLDLVRGAPATNVDDAWGIVVISKSGGTLETAVSLRVFLEALRDSCAHDEGLIADRVIPVTGTSGKLFELAQAIGCPDIFKVPDGVGGRFSVLSAVGLIPAAILGLDVVKLLEGAAAMTEHFRTAPPCDNRVLDYVGVCHLMEDQRMANLRVLSVWSKALESVGLWYDQLLAESIGKQERGATPLTVLNTRDLHSRAQQHQEGTRDKLFTNIVLDDYRTDPITVTASALNQDELNSIAGKTMPDLMKAAFDGTNAAYKDDGRPTADIRLPDTSEYSLGQLLQMLMLATVVEGRLIGINPYGQPGVEGYKQHMKKNLGM